MPQRHKIQLFEDKQVRTVWDDELQKWFFSIVDVCGILTEQPDYDHAKNYWKVLKHRLIKEGNESVTNCNQLKLVSPKDGKRYKTDVADFKQLFRVIQSIPSRKAEPFKEWMAERRESYERVGMVFLTAVQLICIRSIENLGNLHKVMCGKGYLVAEGHK